MEHGPPMEEEMDLSDWIERQAAFASAKLALACSGRRYGYADLAALIGRVARALDACGTRRGDRVACLGYNGVEQIALLFACARLGAVFAPLSWRLAPPEHRTMLIDCRPHVVVVADPFVEPTSAVASEVPVRVALPGPHPGWIAWDAFLDDGRADALPAREDRRADPLLLCYTSGSTGLPKGVVLTQDALLHNAINSAHMHDLTSTDVVLTTLPLFHVGGLNIQTLPALHAGATVLLHARFAPGDTIDALERDGVTLTVLVPAQLEAIAREPRWPEADLSRLRAITTGSTIIDAGFVRRNLQRGVPLLQVYGSTETCPIAAYQRVDDAPAHPGSIGKAALHCEVRLADEAGRDVAPGASGEMWVRGPSVMSGYWDKPRETREALAGGWYRTGDVAHVDADGWLYVDGRRRDVIITGGENVYPAEIENALAGCPDIAEIAVVGRPDPRWGEAVVAVVVPANDVAPSRESLCALLEGRVARYKHPRDVVVVAGLPRTALGKVKRDELRRLALGEAVAGHA